MRRLTPCLALLPVIAGCGILNPCDERVEYVEVWESGGLAEVSQSIYDGFQAAGWECRWDSFYRDADGNKVTVWRCTICD